MAHAVKILKDSLPTWINSDLIGSDVKGNVGLENGRLITFELTYPRIIHGEMMTHRVFSRNSASSRAIPVEKMIKMTEDNPYIPTYWGKNKSGMQAVEEISEEARVEAKEEWLHARDLAVASAHTLLGLGVHKEITNRLLEPFMWHTIILTGDMWNNFFELRDHEAAHPEIQKLARMMKEAINNSTPKYRIWHVPFVDEEIYDEHPNQDLLKIATARCARVSYLNHDNEIDIDKDIRLHDMLGQYGHMSPFEHIAYPSFLKTLGNFNSWSQYRHAFEYMKFSGTEYKDLRFFDGTNCH